MGNIVNMVDPSTGEAHGVPEESIAEAAARGWKIESDPQALARASADAEAARYGGVEGAVNAYGAGVWRGATLGGSDVVAGAVGGDQTRQYLHGVQQQNPLISTGGELVGTVAGGELLPAGQVAKLGGRVEAALAGEGAGALAKVGAAGARGATEGALYGAGSGVSELALSDDPVTLERMASVIGSHALYGAGAGAAAGGVLKAGELGLGKAADALRESVAARQGLDAIPEDLAGLDAKGLRAARDSELEGIEAARVPERQSIADDLATFRSDLKGQKLWLATKDAEDAEIKVLGKRTLNADKQLDRILDNPKYLAENPKTAISALQKQEAALEELTTKHADKLKAVFATDQEGVRRAALDAIPNALERNRALQQRIADVAAEPSSTRLTAIEDAKDALLTAGAREKSLPEQLLAGTVFGKVTALASPLGPLAPLLGARASKAVSEFVFGKLGKATSAAVNRGKEAAATFFEAGAKAAQKGAGTAPVLATKVLESVRYAPARPREASSEKVAPRDRLATAYNARAAEIRSQVVPGPTGALQMRPEARAVVAKQLAPIAAVSPVVADRIETLAARKIEFLAAKLPTRPGIGMQLGPDHWQPSDLEMRQFARYAAAVEDPHAVFERLSHGSVTPEDAEAVRSVYPELMADFQAKLVEKLPTLRKQLPYHRRLALSIFSGVPVDPALDPRVLSVLQGQFAAEEGSGGGMQAPTAQPQFGSVKAEQPTPSQERAAGGPT